MRNYYEEMTSLQKHHYFSGFFIKLLFFREKQSLKRKTFLRNNHYFSDFFPTNSDLFTHIIEFDIAGFAAQIFDEIEPKTAPQSPQHLKFCNNCATIFLT